ncbi:MAG TPA: PIN domain-containing protein [Rhizomicrobium sp.]|nr:PIN domain-containing protein [Rhizomicrobium sp.]
MIAADRTALTAFFKGEECRESSLVFVALTACDLCLPPVVLTEMLSNPASEHEMLETVAGFTQLDVTEGFWERAGALRRSLKQHGVKAKVRDALIAQSCIDHDIALITRNADLRVLAKHCGLKLA